MCIKMGVMLEDCPVLVLWMKNKWSSWCWPVYNDGHDGQESEDRKELQKNVVEAWMWVYCCQVEYAVSRSCSCMTLLWSMVSSMKYICVMANLQPLWPDVSTVKSIITLQRNIVLTPMRNSKSKVTWHEFPYTRQSIQLFMHASALL